MAFELVSRTRIFPLSPLYLHASLITWYYSFPKIISQILFLPKRPACDINIAYVCSEGENNAAVPPKRGIAAG
jgi:hypothetical protein